MTKITEQLKTEILNDDGLKKSNFKVRSEARELINKLNEYQKHLDDDDRSKKPTKFLTDEELDSINDHEGNNWEIIIQALCNNGLEEFLFNFINYEKKVRKNPATAIQAINGEKGNIKMKNFTPQLESVIDQNAELIQSIHGRGDIIIDGDFSPNWNANLTTDSKSTKLTSQVPSSNQTELFNLINQFLNLKKNFLIARQETITKLQECYNAISKRSWYSTNDRIAQAINVAGEFSLTMGIPKMIGGAIILVNGIIEERNSNGQLEKVIDLLEGEQKFYQWEVVNHLVDYINKSSYSKSVNNVLSLKEGQLFSDYDPKSITNFWTDKKLNLQQIDDIIRALNDNCSILLKELIKQAKDLRELFGNGILDLELFFKQYALQEQIVQQSQVLKKLIEKAEVNLEKSRSNEAWTTSNSVKSQRKEERKQSLSSYLNSNSNEQARQNLKRNLGEAEFSKLDNVNRGLIALKQQFRKTIERLEMQITENLVESSQEVRISDSSQTI